MRSLPSRLLALSIMLVVFGLASAYLLDRDIEIGHVR